MAFPSQIVLPANAKYHKFIAVDKILNSNYDITWSFEFKMSAGSAQYGFSTFISTVSAPLSCLPGQYLGTQDPLLLLSGSTIQTDTGDDITTGLDELIILDNTSLSGTLITIAFDSTGLFALSGINDWPGTGLNSIKSNALVVRGYDQNVILNSALSTLSSSFALVSPDFQTLRFRYANLGNKVSIDYRNSNTTTYTELTSFSTTNSSIRNYINIGNVYVGFCFCSPISSAISNVSSLLLRNFHVEGFSGTTNTSSITSRSLSANTFGEYTVITGVTANP